MAIRTRLTEFFWAPTSDRAGPDDTGSRSGPRIGRFRGWGLGPAGSRLCRASLVHGESIGLVRDIPRAGELVRRISAEATARLSPGRQNQFVGEAGAAAERT